MTREQIEAMLASLTRYEERGDYSGSNWLVPCEDGEPGEFVRFDDVREILEGMIEAPHEGD